MGTKTNLRVLKEILPGITGGEWEWTISADSTFSVYGNTQRESMADADLVAHGIREMDDAEFIDLASRCIAPLLQAAEALPKLIELVLDMGHTIRHADDGGNWSEYWTNDADGVGEYVPDDRFAAAQAALNLLQGEGV